MPLLAHISDLHFNSVRPAIAEALSAELHQRAPNVLVVSGDLTQRGRHAQYAAAANYLAALPHPQIVVPGNHDIVLYDVFRRFFHPLDRYRQYISDELFPFYQDQEIAVLGVNTARSWTWSFNGFWRDGRISPEQLQEIQRRFSLAPPDHFKILVTHHPFIPPPHRRLHGIVGGAQQALDVLQKCGVDLLLAGHLHTSYSGDVRPHYEAIDRTILSVQAGSAISTRLRREPNAYDLISIESNILQITARIWTGTSFSDGSILRCHKIDHVWRPAAAESLK